MRRCGLTLLEVLIALVLLLALGAIVFPAFSYKYDRVVFNTCVGQVQSVINYARAEAQYRGEILAVVWDRDQGVLEVGAYNNLDTNGREEGFDNDNAEVISDSSGGEGELSGFLDLKSLSWTRYKLPDGLVIRIAGVGGGGSDMDGLSGITDEDYYEDEWDDGSSNNNSSSGYVDSIKRLVILLPDGSALSEVFFELVDKRGRAAQFEINQWTGTVNVSFMSGEEVGAGEDVGSAFDSDGDI